METTIMGLYRDYRGIVCKGYVGLMGKKMETTLNRV